MLGTVTTCADFGGAGNVKQGAVGGENKRIAGGQRGKYAVTSHASRREGKRVTAVTVTRLYKDFTVSTLVSRCARATTFTLHHTSARAGTSDKGHNERGNQMVDDDFQLRPNRNFNVADAE